MAAFDFPNSPSNNQTHTQNGVEWKWNGSVWKRVESVAEKGQKGDDIKGQKGESVKGQKGETGSGSSNASTVTIRTEGATASDSANHPLIFVDSSTDNQAQTLKMDDQEGRLVWNPYANNFGAVVMQSAYIREWSTASVGIAGSVLTSNASNNWAWTTPKAKVACNVRQSDLANFSDNVWGNAMQCQFNTKDAGSSILVRANINFTYGIVNDTDDDGSMNVYFKIMRNIGSGWDQVGESLDMTNLYDESGNNSQTKLINCHGGLEWPDAQTSTVNHASTIYYALYAKYDEFGDDVSNSSFKILKGSSLTAMVIS